jgi:hypothetical protein
VGCWKAGGGAADAVTASGGGDRLGQEAHNVVEQGDASAGVGSGGAEARTARGTVLSGAEPAVTAHMAGLQRRRAAEGNRGGREGGRRRGT